MMEEANAVLLFVGHSHKPYHRITWKNKVYKTEANLDCIADMQLPKLLV